MRSTKFFPAYAGILTILMILIMSSCNKEGFQGDNVAVSITGSAQKGQFTQGSQLTAFGLNSNLVASGKSFPGSITDDMGNFSISGEVEDPYMELRAEGYYFNELTGELSGPLYLEALLEPSATKVNINILTTIIRQRVKELILSGDKYSSAVDKAQQEFLTSLSVSLEKSADFDQMDITKSSDSDAFLLALSCMVQVDNSPAQINALLQMLADDMKDGSLTDDNKSLLWEKGKKVSITAVTENLEKFYQSKQVQGAAIPKFWKYLQPTGYAELLSFDVLKGACLIDNHDFEIYDVSLDDNRVEFWNQRFYDASSGRIVALNKPDEYRDYSIENIPEFYGDYSFEIVVLLKDEATVASSVPWITVEEIESMGADRYKYKISVSAEGCKNERSGILSFGGRDYNIVVRNDIYSLSEIDLTTDYILFDVKDMCFTACRYLTIESQKFEASVDGKKYPVVNLINAMLDFGCIFVPDHDLLKEHEENRAEDVVVICMSIDGVTLCYVPGPEIYRYGVIRPRDIQMYDYLAMRCPFANLENNFTASPLNILKINGNEYKPCNTKKLFCLYAVEQAVLQSGVAVEISNSQHGNGTGVIQELPIGDPMVDGFSARYQVNGIQMQ